MAGDPSFKGSFPVAVDYRRCANGATYEFWLTLGGRRVSDLGILRSVRIGDSLDAHAAAVLLDLLENHLPSVGRTHA